MARKQIVQFDAASSIASTDRFLLQQGAAGTAFTYGTVAQLLAGGLASTYSSVTVNGATIPPNGIYLPASNTLGFSVNTTAEMQMTGTALSPATSDGLALGTSSLMWSDVFLASGAVLNFSNGDVTITHSADTLTVAGGALAVGALSATTGAFSSTATATAFIPSSATVPTDGMYLPTTNTLAWATNSAHAMRLDANGHLVIGTTSASGRLHVTRDSTAASGATYIQYISGAQSVANTGQYVGIGMFPTYTASTPNTLVNFYGAWFAPNNTGSGSVTNLIGTRSIPVNSGSGAVANHYAGMFIAQNAGTGTVTSQYGMYVRNDNSNAGGTVTTAYGLYIATPINSGTIVSNYGIYQQDPNALNTFLGKITAASFIPSSATVPTNGMYYPASNTLGWAINSAAEMQLTSTALSPAVSDGLALGTTTLMWSDVFLASGAVINFSNGDMTITHGSNVLTIAGGSLAIETMLMASLAAGPSYDDDAAAASGGVAIGQMYRNGNFLMVRLT